MSEAGKKYYEANREKILERNRQRYANNKDYWVQYNKDNRKRVTQYQYIYQHRELPKLARSIRQETRNFLKTNKDYSEILNCSRIEFKNWIESKMKEGMTWENKNIVWEFDHVIPLSQFDLRNYNEYQMASFYKNVQPVFIQENRKKSNKIAGKTPRRSRVAFKIDVTDEYKKLFSTEN
jgi:hypothetical protein